MPRAALTRRPVVARARLRRGAGRRGRRRARRGVRAHARRTGRCRARRRSVRTRGASCARVRTSTCCWCTTCGPAQRRHRAGDDRTALVPAVGRGLRHRPRGAHGQGVGRARRRRPRRAHRVARRARHRRRARARGRARSARRGSSRRAGTVGCCPCSPTRSISGASARARSRRCSSPTSKKARAGCATCSRSTGAGWALGAPGGDGDVDRARLPHARPTSARVEAGRELLLDIRVALQRVTSSHSDRLALQEQDAVAAQLGFASADALVHDLASASREIAWIAGDVWSRVRDMLDGPRANDVPPATRPIAEGVWLRDGRVHIDTRPRRLRPAVANARRPRARRPRTRCRSIARR